MPVELRTLAVLRTHFLRPTELLDLGSSTDIFPPGEKSITAKLRTLAVLPTLFGCLGNVSVELPDLSSSVGLTFEYYEVSIKLRTLAVLWTLFTYRI